MDHRRGAATMAIGAALLIGLATAGCGRSGHAVDTAGATQAPAQPTPIAEQASPIDSTASEAASPESGLLATATPDPTATPVPTPDLAGIQDLLDQLGRDLAADASASTSEGSPQ